MSLAAAGCHYFQAASILTLQTSRCQPQVTVPYPRKETKSKHFHSNSKAFDSNAEINLNSAVNRQEEKNPNKHTLVSWASSWTGYKDLKPLFIKGKWCDHCWGRDEIKAILVGSFKKQEMVLDVLASLYIHLPYHTDSTVVTHEGRKVWVHNIPPSCINMLDFAPSPLLFYNDNNCRRKHQKSLKPLPTINYNLPRKINCRDSILLATSLLLPVLIVPLLL